MNLGNHFGDFVFRERKKRKWTQTELVKATGLTRATVSIIESRGQNLTLNNLEKILCGLDLTLRDFVNFIDEAR